MVWVWSMSCGDGVGVVHELWDGVGVVHELWGWCGCGP